MNILQGSVTNDYHFVLKIKSKIIERNKNKLPGKENLVTASEIEKIISGLTNNKAPGHNGITNETIKNLATILIPFLVNFFNYLLKKLVALFHQAGK